MISRNFSKLKPIIGLIILLGILGVGTLSVYSMNHSQTAHLGCLSLSTGMSPCEALVDLVSCLRTHLGILQAISQTVSLSASQLLTALVVAAALWLVVKRKPDEPAALTRLRLWRRYLNFGHNILLKKLGQWLRLLEKRAPAQNVLVVLGILLRPAM
ncbi:MAG: hypothetical protein HY973_00660 [Candidatus Kerfeldbacteria bacterium]|nr:hypothetical protein [Candidatus Kerfeldbacteria bacterium]